MSVSAADDPAELAPIVDAVSQALRDGERDRAEALALDALQRFQGTDQVLPMARLKRRMGEIYILKNRYDDAEPVLRDALELLAPFGTTAEFGHAQFQMARLHRYRAEYPSALAMLSRAERTFTQLDDKPGLVLAYNLYGVINRFLGQFEQSLEWQGRSLQLAREVGDEAGLANSLYNIAGINESLGQYAEALEYYRDVLSMDEATGIPNDIAYSEIRVGMMLMELSALGKARVHLERARDLFEQINAPRDFQWAVATLARLEGLEGRHEAARTSLEDVLARALLGSWPVLSNRARQWLVEIEMATGRLDSALAYLETGLEDALSQQSMDRALRLYALKVEVLEAVGRSGEALSALRARNALRQSLSDELRTSVMAAMQSSGEFERQSVALKLAQQEREVARLELQRESVRRYVWLGGLLSCFCVSFLIYGRIESRRQNLRLQKEVADKTHALRERHEELERAYDAVDRASITDPLTGLANRRFLERHIDADTARTVRLWTSADGSSAATTPDAADLVFFMLDLDHFKAVNDRYGHATGDTVLVAITDILEREYRKADFRIRWGGEEFLVVARFINRREAPAIAERVRAAVATTEFPVEGHAPIRCTCSIGFAAFPFVPESPHGVNWQGVVELADQALYSVKTGGRNGWAGYFAPHPVTPGELIAEWVPGALERGEVDVVRSTQP